MRAMNAPDRPVIHIVDDEDNFRTALARLLAAHGFIVREYASAGDFLLAWPTDALGCLLLDVRMPGPSGLELQAALAERGDALPVIFLTGYGDVPTSVRAMRRGAIDFLTKPVDTGALLSAIRAALRCDAERRELARHQRELRERYDTLTPRERAVFSQVIAGRLNKQIAGTLNTCERTVKAHRAHVMQKLHARSVADLVHISVELDGSAARAGWLSPAAA
jgi:FixJ family two-component response regulator